MWHLSICFYCNKVCPFTLYMLANKPCLNLIIKMHNVREMRFYWKYLQQWRSVLNQLFYLQILLPNLMWRLGKGSSEAANATQKMHYLKCFVGRVDRIIAISCKKNSFNVFIGCWCARATRANILSASLKPSIPQLNLWSVHSRLAEWHSQHLKCLWIINLIWYTKLNTVSLIHFSNSKKSKITPKHN